MPAAARLGDFHICPKTNPPPANTPHVGGPVMPAGCITSVIIGGVPAAVKGTMCVCAGPPDKINKGSSSVMIGGKPAARQGDTTEHGGSIQTGLFTVIIGD